MITNSFRRKHFNLSRSYYLSVFSIQTLTLRLRLAYGFLLDSYVFVNIFNLSFTDSNGFSESHGRSFNPAAATEGSSDAGGSLGESRFDGILYLEGGLVGEGIGLSSGFLQAESPD